MIMDDFINEACGIKTEELGISARALIQTYLIERPDLEYSTTNGYLISWKGFLEYHNRPTTEIESFVGKTSEEKLFHLFDVCQDLGTFLGTLKDLDFFDYLKDVNKYGPFENLIQNKIRASQAASIEKEDTETGTLKVTHDAYMVYAEEDIQLVKNLSRVLEEGGVKIFIRDRNLIPGDATLPSLVETMRHRVNKILVLLTANFVKSELCDFQRSNAHWLSPVASSKKICCLILDGNCPIPKEFKFLVHITLNNKDCFSSNMNKLFTFLGFPANGHVQMESVFPNGMLEAQHIVGKLRRIESRCDQSHFDYTAFLSYSTKDVPVAFIRQLITTLEDEEGLKLFICDRDSLPGTPLYEEMTRNIEKSEKVVLLLSPTYHKTEECEFQTLFALSLSPHARTKAIIPVILKRPCLIPEVIRHIDPVDLEKTQIKEKEFKRLLSALKTPPRYCSKCDGLDEAYFEHQEIRLPTQCNESLVTLSDSSEVTVPKETGARSRVPRLLRSFSSFGRRSSSSADDNERKAGSGLPSMTKVSSKKDPVNQSKKKKRKGSLRKKVSSLLRRRRSRGAEETSTTGELNLSSTSSLPEEVLADPNLVSGMASLNLEQNGATGGTLDPVEVEDDATLSVSSTLMQL